MCFHISRFLIRCGAGVATSVVPRSQPTASDLKVEDSVRPHHRTDRTESLKSAKTPESAKTVNKPALSPSPKTLPLTATDNTKILMSGVSSIVVPAGLRTTSNTNVCLSSRLGQKDHLQNDAGSSGKQVQIPTSLVLGESSFRSPVRIVPPLQSGGVDASEEREYAKKVNFSTED